MINYIKRNNKKGDQNMNSKKTIQILITIAAILICFPCFATIPKEEMTIGDIYIGQPAQEVFEKYGKPVSQEEIYGNKKLNYIIKNGITESFAVITKETNNKPITGVSLTTNIGLKTKAGIGIGSTKEEITQIYGKPDSCTDPTGSPISIDETDYQGAFELKYKADNNEPYELKITLEGPEHKVTAIGISTTQ